MAEELTLTEQKHQQAMERAVQAIRLNADLRYFVRQVFQLMGLDSHLNLESTNTAMHQFGRQSAATDLAALLMSYDITLYADLLREDALQSITETPNETDT